MFIRGLSFESRGRKHLLLKAYNKEEHVRVTKTNYISKKVEEKKVHNSTRRNRTSVRLELLLLDFMVCQPDLRLGQ